MVSGCIAYAYHQYTIIEENTILRKTLNYEKLSSTASVGSTIFFGDSISEQCPLEDIYRDYMKIHQVQVINRGISSEQSDTMLERIETTVLALEPKNVVMLMGINDMLAGVKQDTVVQNIKDMISITKQKSPQTNIILQSIYPINKEVRTSLIDMWHVRKVNNEDIVEINKKLKKLASDEDIAYVDVHPVLVDSNGDFKKEYAYDGLHPNAQGYLAIRDLITSKLQ